MSFWLFVDGFKQHQYQVGTYFMLIGRFKEMGFESTNHISRSSFCLRYVSTNGMRMSEYMLSCFVHYFYFSVEITKEKSVIEQFKLIYNINTFYTIMWTSESSNFRFTFAFYHVLHKSWI